MVGERGSWGGVAWVWLVGLFAAATFLEAMFWGQMGAFTPLYLPSLGVPAEEVTRLTGQIVAFSSLVGLPFLPFWGALADRYGRQPIIVRSYAAYLLAAIVTTLATTVWLFAIGRAFMSLSMGNTGLMLTTLTERAPRERRGLSFALVSTASPIGAFVGPLLGGPIVDSWGFRTLLLVNGLVMLVVILALLFSYRDPFTPTQSLPLVTMAVDGVRTIWRTPRLRALFPALFLLQSGFTMASTYLPITVATLYHGPDLATTVGIVSGVAGFVALVLALVVGALADRLGHWRMLFITASLSVALWPLPGLARALVPFTAMWALIDGVAAGVFALSFAVLAASATTATRGRVMSFSFLPAVVGYSIGPIIGSVITQRSVFTIFPAAAALTAVGVGALALAYRVAPTREGESHGDK